MSNTLTVLINARKLIEKPENWGQWFRSRCAGEAIVDAGGEWTGKHGFALAAAIGLSIPHHIPTWNDAPGRKHSEVLAAFDKAIANERAKFEAQFLDPQQTQSDCTEPSSTRAAAELVP